MNVAGLIFLAFVIVAAYSCIRSDWKEFDEEDETSDEPAKPEDDWFV